MSAPILGLRQIEKAFGALQVTAGVTLDIAAG